MASFFLEKGLVISYEGRILEYNSRNDNELYFEEPETGRRRTLTESEFWSAQQTNALRIVDAFSSSNRLLLPNVVDHGLSDFKDLNAIPNKYQLDHDRKITYLKKLREAGITRGQKRLIASQAESISKEIDDPLGVPGTSTLQKWWKEIDTACGDLLVVINKNSYRKRKKQFDAESETFLQDHIDDHYAQPTRPTVVGAYRDYCVRLTQENTSREANALPLLAKVSERTYGKRIEDRPKKDIMTFRFGREAARHHFKMIQGHLAADKPLDAVEIDHTPMNMYVIDDFALLPLGRPWLTAIKDRYSGILLGFYVSFQPTGLTSIFGAIKHSLSSHHMAYEIWPDIENGWPSFGRGIWYVSDRGSDFNCQRYRNAIKSLNAFWEYCERRTPWLKGSIERFFLTLEQTFFEAMPGRTYASLEKRGDYDPANDAVIRFSTLIYLLHKWAADYHNIIANKRNQATPLTLWQEGIKTAPPPYPCSIDELNITLGEHHTGVLSQEGIRFSWQTYADDQLSAVMDDVGKGASVSYVVSVEDLGQVYVEHPRTREYLCIPSTRPEYSSGLSLLQHKFLRKEANVRLEKTMAIDTLIATRDRMQAVFKEELDAKTNAGKVRLARITGINSNSVLEGNARSIAQPFAGQNLGSTQQESAAYTGPSFTDVPRFAWGS